MLRLVEDDYDVLRRFQARSSLPTYVTVVIQRLFLDYRNRLWGKWRPDHQGETPRSAPTPPDRLGGGGGAPDQQGQTRRPHRDPNRASGGPRWVEPRAGGRNVARQLRPDIGRIARGLVRQADPASTKTPDA